MQGKQSKTGLPFPLLSKRMWGCWHAVYPACQAQREEPFWAHACHVLKVYCALQACPFFSSLGCICCACSGKHQSGGRNYSVFSARGCNVGEVSLKVIRSHTLSILLSSLEISREKIQLQARGCFLFCRIQGQCIMTLLRAEKGLMGSEIPGTALCRVRVVKKYELYPVTLDRCVMHIAVCFTTGLSNGSIQEKFDGRVVEECLFSFCSFFPYTQFWFSILSSRKYCCNHCRDEERVLLSSHFFSWKLEKLQVLEVYPGQFGS